MAKEGHRGVFVHVRAPLCVYPVYLVLRDA